MSKSGLVDDEAGLKKKQDEARNRASLVKQAEDSIRKLQKHVNTLEAKVISLEIE